MWQLGWTNAQRVVYSLMASYENEYFDYSIVVTSGQPTRSHASQDLRIAKVCVQVYANPSLFSCVVFFYSLGKGLNTRSEMINCSFINVSWFLKLTFK